MPHIACPTCAHSFDTDDLQLDEIISCPNCKLSRRAPDNIVLDPDVVTKTDFTRSHGSPRSSTLTEWWQDLSPQQQELAAWGGAIALIVFVAMLILNGGVNSDKTPVQPQPVAPNVSASPLTAPPSQAEPIQRRGQIDRGIAEKTRRGWQHGNFRSADRDEQIAAMIVIQIGVEKAISDPLDREATLDYIQQNIDSW